MSNLNRFLKENKKQRENVTYAVTKSLTDEDGNAMEWTMRPISSRENDVLREECTTEVPVKAKGNMYRQKFNASKYLAKMICACVVFPNLNDKELQDSYGVMNPEDLLKELVDEPGEYNDLGAFVQELNGFTTMDEKVDEAKN